MCPTGGSVSGLLRHDERAGGGSEVFGVLAQMAATGLMDAKMIDIPLRKLWNASEKIGLVKKTLTFSQENPHCQGSGDLIQ